MTKKTILHICNDFLGSTVYKELYAQLDRKNVKQAIFVPLRSVGKKHVNDISFATAGSSIVYSDLLKKYHRVFFNSKIDFLLKSLINQIDIKDIGVLHATTFFSDGVIAYKIFKTYDIPYIVTVRSTDVDVFLKFRPDLLPVALKVIKNAKHIIFISKAIEKKFLSHFLLSRFSRHISPKSSVIYNGVNRLWLDNLHITARATKPYKVLYVGTFIKRKRVRELITAVGQLRAQFPNLRLCIVGGGGKMEKKVLRLIEENEEFIEYRGVIKHPDVLIQIFRENHIFAMPSYNETFGLVYVEALSQGLPILLGKNEAIDDVLENVGESVDPHSIKSIREGLMRLVENYPRYNIGSNDLQQFDWDKISRLYLELYNSLL